MRKLGFVGLGLLVLSQAACIFVSEDTNGQFDVTWNVTIQGANADFCSDVGAAAVETIATPAAGPAYSDIFRNCDAWAGRTASMPQDVYTIAWGLLDPQDFAITATTEPAPLTVDLNASVVTLPLATWDF